MRPIGIAAAPDGTLLITDAGRHAVLRSAPPTTRLPLLPPAEPTAAPAGAAPTSAPLPSPPGR